MERRGLSVIVGTLLFVLITVIAVSVLWVGYSKLTNKSSSSDSFDCSLVSVRPMTCIYASQGTSLPGEDPLEFNTGFGSIRREIGGGEITSVKMAFIESDGLVHFVDPQEYNSDQINLDNDFSNFEEFTTKRLINQGDLSISSTVNLVFNVVVVVGDGTICEPDYEPVPCLIL